MTDELLGVATVTMKDSGSAQVVIGPAVLDALGEPEQLAWFIDHDSGLVYAVPVGEVTVR